MNMATMVAAESVGTSPEQKFHSASSTAPTPALIQSTATPAAESKRMFTVKLRRITQRANVRF